MKLDLRQQGQIPPHLLPFFNRLASDSRCLFTDFIESLSLKYSDNLDWHLTGPAERNVFSSPLFDYCCRFVFLQQLLERGEQVSEVVTDSPAFQKILKEWLAGRGADIAVHLDGNPLKQHFYSFSRLFGYLFVHLWEYLIGRLSGFGKSVLPREPLTIIDTFVMAGFIDKERYYPGLLENLPPGQRRLVYFVPTLYRIRPGNMLSVWRKMRASPKNFLFKEDFLKLSDYFFAWFHWLRVRRISFGGADFKGSDFAGLIREEVLSCKGLGSAMIGLLNYRFIRRLKEHGVRVRLAVDWFENQVIDKGWNNAFSKHFPETPTVGYLGFVTTPYYLCAQPTSADRKAGLLPKRLAVTGRALIQTTREFCSDLEVGTAPAFRFSHLYKPRRFYPDPSCFTILVGLSFSLAESVNMLDLVRQVSLSFGREVVFIIKRHPATSIEQLQIRAAWLLEKQFEFSDQPFDELVEKCNLLISGVSSVCMESLAKGVPVIVIGNRNGVTYNPIPQSVCAEIWRLCYSVDELKDAVVFFEGRNRHDRNKDEQEGLTIRDQYFTPVTEENVRDFLMLN